MRERREGIRVLLVHPAGAFSSIAQSWLESQAKVPRIDVACSAPEGLRAVEQGSWDFVLIDGALPERAAFELTRQIKRRPNAPAVIVLVLFGSNVFRREAELAGADACIEKSAFANSLRTILDAYTNKLRKGQNPAPSLSRNARPERLP